MKFIVQFMNHAQKVMLNRGKPANHINATVYQKFSIVLKGNIVKSIKKILKMV